MIVKEQMVSTYWCPQRRWLACFWISFGCEVSHESSRAPTSKKFPISSDMGQNWITIAKSELIFYKLFGAKNWLSCSNKSCRSERNFGRREKYSKTYCCTLFWSMRCPQGTPVIFATNTAVCTEHQGVNGLRIGLDCVVGCCWAFCR